MTFEHSLLLPSSVMSNYTAAPPAYADASATPKKYGAAEPLLPPQQQHGASSSGSNAYFNQGDSDVPDDFLYGTSAWESAAEIKNGELSDSYTCSVC